MKKLLSFFLSIALLSTLSFTAYATEVAPSVPQEHAIPSIPEEISFSHRDYYEKASFVLSFNRTTLNVIIYSLRHRGRPVCSPRACYPFYS